MNSIIYSLFISLAIRMTVVTAFVFIIKLLFRHKLSAKMHCLMWSVLLVQTVFCVGNVSIPSKTSIYNFVPQTPVITQSEPIYDMTVFDVKNVVALIYVIGVIVMAIWNICVFLVYRRKAFRLEKINDPATLEVLEDAKKRLGVSDNILLRLGEYAQTVSNIVILPNGYNHNEEHQILLHELCHYKNKDNIKLWLAISVVCLNWFNPFIWAAFFRYRSDIEMYCDENVMKVTESRKEYAKVLLKTASERSKFIPGAAGVSNGKHEVSRRVKVIVAWKKKRRVWFVAAIMACTGIGCMCLTDAVSVAVETNVEIAATPKPVDNIAEQFVTSSTPTPPELSTPSPHPTQYITKERKTDEYVEQSEYYNQNTQPVAEIEYDSHEEYSQVVNEEVGTQSPTYVPEVKEDTEQSENVEYQELGELESVSANGSKETYSLDDGRTAVLHYDGDTLETGYIISEDVEQNNTEQMIEK